MPARELFLHEFIDIIGQGQWAYMEHAKAQAGHEKVDFELLGTWYTMGITGRWPQVINIWEIPGGWDGWYGKVDRLGLKRRTNADLFKWWDTAYKLQDGRLRPIAGRASRMPQHRAAHTRTGEGHVVRPRGHDGEAGHGHRVPRRDARGAPAVDERIRPPPRRPLRSVDARLRGLHGLGDQRRRSRAYGQGVRCRPRAARRRKRGRCRRLAARRMAPGRAAVDRPFPRRTDDPGTGHGLRTRRIRDRRQRARAARARRRPPRRARRSKTKTTSKKTAAKTKTATKSNSTSKSKTVKGKTATKKSAAGKKRR